MTRKAIEKKLNRAERFLDTWDRTLLTAANKIRFYRRRTKYYRAKLAELPSVNVSHRVRRKIQTGGLEG